MNNEIKEILDWLKDEDIYLEDHGYQYKRISLKETKQLLDYITKLQEDVRIGQEINTELQQENEIRQQDINNLTYQLAKMKEENESLRTRIKTIKRLRKKQTAKKNKYKSLIFNEEKALHDYKSRCEKASDKIQYIIDYGFDYDGFNTVESLKGLIDMLVDYAKESKNILQNGSDDSV